ncbi:thermonuclease family protein [Candidatus Gottesmanbacteria bacterium]|nr:thermonuclease family protein [Candidatus Gottesmanbacteria bacterium]
MAKHAGLKQSFTALVTTPWIQRLGWSVLIVSLALNVVLGVPLLQKSKISLPSETATTVTNIVDGDTFDTKDGTRVRLLGLDAPEYPQGCLSKRARERLSELILGKEVALDVTGEDRFGRKIAWVTIKGDIPLSIVLVEEGLATADKIGDSRGAQLLQAQTKARETKRGIWSAECTSARVGCTIKGNYHKGTKERTYHLPGCYNYDQISINPNESDRWFCTEGEAEAAGFTKSRDCPGGR